MILNANELDVTQTYKLLIATIVARPIGWISTLSTDGVPNLAPFSFFTVVGRAVGAGGSGDCPTNGHSVLGRKIGTKRLIQRGLRSQSPWDRSLRSFRRG
jgi:hypothetical protein